MRVFFDNAATTALDQEVAKEMLHIMQVVHGNPSSIHKEGREARTIIEKARKNISKIMGVAPGEIFFTSGGTEADNMAIKCLVKDKGITKIISSPIEHHAVTHTVEELHHQFGVEVVWLNILPDGHIDYSQLHTEILAHPAGKVLVSLMHANNEIGNLLDVKLVSNYCKENNAYFHCDMVQTVGHLPLNLKELGVDFMAASAHKFNGPKGVGFIYINNEVKINPFIAGGAQERNMRGGTENIYGIVGLSKALEIAINELDQQHQNIQSIKSYMREELQKSFQGLIFNGDQSEDKSLFTVLNVCFPTFKDADMILFNLDIEGIAASGGSACSSGSSIGSHVLQQLNLPEGYTAVRFSFGKHNTFQEVDYVIDTLKKLINK